MEHIQTSHQQLYSEAGSRKKKVKAYHQRKLPGSPSHRRSLVQLQPHASDQTKLVGKDGVIRLTNPRSNTPKRKRDEDEDADCKRSKTLRCKHFEVYDENIATTNKKNKSTEDEAHELMVQEEVPDKYWEALAEERRVALEETLKENEKLHGEIKELKEENERLKVTADQAVYLADVVQELLGEKKVEEKEDDLESDEEQDKEESPSQEDKESEHGVTSNRD